MTAQVRRLHQPAPPTETPAAPDLGALEAISTAVESGSGLPEVIRAVARVLDASVALSDRDGNILAVAARSPADERSLAQEGSGVVVEDLRVADEPVGRMRIRLRGEAPSGALLAVIKTLVASEVERLRAPERASREAVGGFLNDLLEQRIANAQEISARAQTLGAALDDGGSVLVIRVHPHVANSEDWRPRVLAFCERGARVASVTSLAALRATVRGAAAEVVVLIPDSDPLVAQRAASGVLAELEAGLHGFTFAIGRSRVSAGVSDLYRAGKEALLAANVAEADGEPVTLAFEQTGAYRLLLPAMSENPEELERFYSETLEPLISYDDQYGTDLVQTLEAFLDCDASIAKTAQRLYTHRHTIRYRLERIRDLTGLDVGSSDGREKLSLGLKSMRVLGIAAPRGPATEAGAKGGKVSRPTDR
ncbi:MAG: helix-turn-helix domain-containing protein [Actinomycetota bacterium]